MLRARRVNVGWGKKGLVSVGVDTIGKYRYIDLENKCCLYLRMATIIEGSQMSEAKSTPSVETSYKQADVRILTDKEFDRITRKLGSIIKGRLSSWTPEDVSHENLLFQ